MEYLGFEIVNIGSGIISRQGQRKGERQERYDPGQHQERLDEEIEFLGESPEVYSEQASQDTPSAAAGIAQSGWGGMAGCRTETGLVANSSKGALF